eukprot:165530_1
MALWWINTHQNIPGWVMIIAISFTALFLMISVQQLCISQITCTRRKKLWSRLLTCIWCFYAFVFNGLLIYSFHNNSHRIMIYVRISMIFGVLLGAIATYRFVIDIVNTVYLYQTKYAINEAPKWFTDTWRIILMFDIISLFIFYGAAFKTKNAIFFDIHFICLGFTFWIGAFACLVAIWRINNFLLNTIFLAAKHVQIHENRINTSLLGAGLSHYDHLNYSNSLINVTLTSQQQNDENTQNKSTRPERTMSSESIRIIQKITKFRKLRLRLILVCFFGVFLVIPITIYTIQLFAHVLNSHYHHAITEQPFPNYFYIGAAIFLNAMDVQLLNWTFTLRNGCVYTANNLFCKIFCCNLCFDLQKMEEPKFQARKSSMSSDFSSSDSKQHNSTNDIPDVSEFIQ